jgi:pyruvate-formate lyase-activating enzyme
MNSRQITIGSIVYGQNKTPAIVLSILDGSLLLETQTGVKKVPLDKVLAVRVSRLKKGDRVRYVGSVDYLETEYAGTLTIVCHEKGVYTCAKPNGYYTSWLDPNDLALEVIAHE